MSKQAETLRVVAVYELEESMRQAKRYLQSKTANPRLVRQKANKIELLENDLRKIHLAYCEKANIDIHSEEAMKYIQEKSDAAVDIIDECLLFIEETEERNSRGDTAKVKIEKVEEEIQRCKSQIAGDERYAIDVSRKIDDLRKTESFTTENMVTMKTYCERYQDIYDSLNVAWNTLITFNDQTENVIKIKEVSESRIQMQDIIAAARVFIETCNKFEEDKKVVLPATMTTLGTAASSSSKVNTKTERIKNPTFSGDIRTFMKFRKDFKQIVEPSNSGAELSYILRESCLQGQAKALVQNIDSVEDIWEKLTDRYGDTMQLVEIVIKELNDVAAMKGSDDRKFIQIVDLLEKGLQDLEAIGARAEIANQYC